MDCSIVIPTYNSEATLEACLKSVRTNSSKYQYELIVCDAQSTDGTLKIAEQYADKVLVGEKGKINRNIGIQNSKGKVILFTDSDCLVPKDWINKLVDGLYKCECEVYKVRGVGGGNIAWLDNPTPIEKAIAKVMVSPLVAFKSRNTANYDSSREVEHNPPINSAYFKWALEKVGGFNESNGYPEDLDLDIRLREKGCHLYYLKDIVVKHKHKDTYESFAKQMRDFGSKRIAINRVYPHISRIYHYAPLTLCLMLYSPLFFIPCFLGILNSRLDFRMFILTLSFYRNYGLGELRATLGVQN
jgi:glycosyltransferase involved in cell wall biosynthesis